MEAARHGSFKILTYITFLVPESRREEVLPACLTIAAEEEQWYMVHHLLVHCELLRCEFTQYDLEEALVAACSARWDSNTSECCDVVSLLLARVDLVPERALAKAIKYHDNVPVVVLLLPRLVGRVTSYHLERATRKNRRAAASLFIQAGASAGDMLWEPVSTRKGCELESRGDWSMLEFLLDKIGSSVIPEDAISSALEEILLVRFCSHEQVRCLDLLLTRPEVRAAITQEHVDCAHSSEVAELLEAALSGAM